MNELRSNNPLPEHVPGEARGARLDHFLESILPGWSRSRIQKRIRGGWIRVEGREAKSGHKLAGGESLQWIEPPPEPDLMQAEEIPLEVLFEDDAILVVNKAPGMVVHPGAGNPAGTLVNALLAYSSELAARAGPDRPGIVHRLDKETSGCLVVAKNNAAHLALSTQFADRTVSKEYLAWVQGVPAKSRGVVELRMGRHPVHRQKMAALERGGRFSKTEWEILLQDEQKSLIRCRLHTGRTHQIRLHLKSIGHPLVADRLYGGRPEPEWPRFMLHAWRLAFAHPSSGRAMRFEAPLPVDFPFRDRIMEAKVEG